MNATIIMKTNTSHPMKVVTTMTVNTSRPLKIIVTTIPIVTTMIVNTSRPLKIVMTMILTSIFEHSVIGATPTDANATTRPMIATTIIPNTVGTTKRQIQ